METILQKFPRRPVDLLLAALLLAAIVIILWLPFNLKLAATRVEWTLRYNYELPHQLVGAPDDQPSRPFLFTFPYLAFALTPKSFIGINLFQIVAFWTKGFAFYVLLKRFIPQKPIALAAAVFLVIYPADDGLMATNAVNIHICVALFLTAVYFLMVLYQRFRFVYAVGMVLSLGVLFLIYEVAYPLAAVTPLLLVLKERRLSRRVIYLALFWYSCVGIFASYTTYQLLTADATYQSSLMETDESESLAGNVLDALKKVYQEHLWVSWADTTGEWATLPTRFVALSLAAGALAAAVMAVLWRFKLPDDVDMIAPKHIGLLLVIGLLVIGLGFAIYLPSSYRTSTVRTYYFTSIGGALVVTALCSLLVLLPAFKRFLFTAVVGILIVLAAKAALKQHQHFVNWSFRQQEVIASIVTQAPELDENVKLVLVLDQNNYITPRIFNGARFLAYGLKLVYDNETLSTVVCNPLQSRPTRAKESCELHPDRITIEGTQKGLLEEYSYEDTLVFSSAAGGKVVLLETLPSSLTADEPALGYAPYVSICETCALPPMAEAMLVEDAFLSSAPQLLEQEPLEEVNYEFADTHVSGTGWGEPRGDPEKTTLRFMLEEQATLLFPLVPNHYRLRMRINFHFAPELLDSLSLQVNGHPIPLDPVSRGVYEARIDASMLTEAITTLLFQVDGDLLSRIQADEGLIGLGFDLLTITPVSSDK